MNASAYVVGPEGPGSTLHALARGLGFEVVLPFTGVAEAERGARRAPLSFFLFAEVGHLAALAPPVQAIRASASPTLRFSPLVYFCHNPSLETIRRCVGMGFDDIITAPFTTERVAGRLMRQVGTELAFFETADYFGPDRRRSGERQEYGTPRRSGQFRRIAIRRDPLNGISVLDDGEQVVL